VFAAGWFGGLAVSAMAAGYYAPAQAYAQSWVERQPAMNRWVQVVSYRNRRVCG
jgi:hypothetical protein